MIQKTILPLLFSIAVSCFPVSSAPVDDILNEYYGENTTVNFIDINENYSWAKEAVSYLATHGAVSGYDGHLFLPDKPITREEFIKILVFAFGITDLSAQCSFQDVNPSAWYYPYIATACKNKIAQGISADSFGIGQPLTREQMITMAYQAAALREFSSTGEGTLSFSDEADISVWARSAVAAFTEKGIINGDLEGNFHPQATATRAQACKIIYFLVKNT